MESTKKRNRWENYIVKVYTGNKYTRIYLYIGDPKLADTELKIFEGLDRDEVFNELNHYLLD